MPKLNIHLTLDNKTLNYCRQVNAGIRKITESVIIFDHKSPMIPHISLIMGELDDNYSVAQLAQIVKKTISHVRPFQFRVLSPYMENVRNRYIFSDVQSGETFGMLKTKLHEVLGSKVLHSQNDYSEVPHITLGHAEEKHEEIRKYLSGVKANFNFTSNAVEVSEAGPKGTCINSLHIFKLRRYWLW
jgi:2'-5' RNA ligase